MNLRLSLRCCSALVLLAAGCGSTADAPATAGFSAGRAGIGVAGQTATPGAGSAAGPSGAGPRAGDGAVANGSAAGRGAAVAGATAPQITDAAGRGGAAVPGRGGAAGAGTTGAGTTGAAGSAAGSPTASAGRGGASGGAAGSISGAAGSGTCDWSDPPADVAGWVDESWDAQLGDNIKNRQAWTLDNVMLNKGELNLCVRWGATMAVPEQVRMNLASTVERWFGDWFKGLGDYGCFPYGAGIKVKVTGWAVRPGQEKLVEGVDSAVPIYTETDGDGEPKCPDACSSFVNWDHDFAGCAKGAEWHSDYWLWFDDRLPGGGGAAAVGGDWGLRMPVSTFLGAFDKPSDHIIEHEMGHGFGIQDYYDWTGAKPAGGSIMIVGSTQSESPTEGDIWLLRRTWQETKKMRGW